MALGYVAEYKKCSSNFGPVQRLQNLVGIGLDARFKIGPLLPADKRFKRRNLVIIFHIPRQGINQPGGVEELPAGALRRQGTRSSGDSFYTAAGRPGFGG